MKKIWMLPVLLLGATGSLLAQEEAKKTLTISGYAEVYYQQDFNNPKSNTRPGFVYSHNRNNEVSLNLGLIKATYETQNTRANLGIGVGSYMNANYMAEPGVLKNIYEANIGIKLSKTHNLWLDAGIFPSHIGFESAISADCYTLTRSIMAENSPYFETGAKLSYGTTNGQWNMAVFILNGWQRIQRMDGNTTPAFGHQLTFRPSDKITLNSSSFIGNDFPESERRMRYFHNLYGQFQVSDQFALIAGFDIGTQQKAKGSSKYSTWYAPALIAKYSPSEKISMAARGEYYHDQDGVIISSGTANGFQTLGASVNIDYQILPNIVWRTEFKNLRSKDAVFATRGEKMKKGNSSLITALAVRF
ncbi:porin [Sphingobacterium sp. N143]|uniref:porin n=1 Tax=Sphingobacterium sp. N143 TaxID=2746727 RepID=UPI0025787224|nr:porin [Sphingobacterium sp. N143]MDM1296289.1 porin [Sphingobacterium sp. N143]